MTSHCLGRIRTVSLSLIVIATVACGSSSKNATITITAPEKGEELTLANDDLDPMKDGLQYNVTAVSSHVAAGTQVILSIDGKSAAFADVASDGSILFDKVTMQPGTHPIKISAANSNVHSAEDWEYTFKALVIERPRDHSALSLADDVNKDEDGIQFNVSVTTYAVAASENVVLQVDGKTVGSPVQPKLNKAVFSNITLESGDHKLKALAGTAESNVVNLSVNPNCASVTYITPKPPEEGTQLILGGGDKCPKDGGPFTTDIEISTDAGNNRDVDLEVNGVFVATAKVNGTLAKFEDVVLDRRENANDVRVTVQGSSGVTCKPVPYPVELLVSCEGADCSISSPKPMAGSDASGARVFYVNKEQRGPDGFEFSVQTSRKAEGKAVKLIVDGNESDAPTAQPTGGGDTLTAKFSGVDLSDGKHMIQARCEDKAGNFSWSNKANWVVDTEACGVDIQEPAAAATILASQDADKNASGTQIAVKSNVSGNDCTQVRGAPCTPRDGIKDGRYSDFDGSSVTTNVTLNSDADQTLCIEVLDRAGNIGRDSVAVKYRSTTPKLRIENPKDGDKYNAEGNDGYKKDSDRGSAAVCNANFDVACTEVGKEVKLHRGDAKGTVFATANCARADNLPAGFAGRARVANATFLPNNADIVKVVATQEIGDTGAIGESDAITLKGDCQVPAVFFPAPDPCEMGQIAVADASSTVTKDVVAGDSTTDTSSAHLTVTSNGSEVTAKDVNVMNGTFTFTSVAFGGPGSGSRQVKLEVSAKDDYANTGRASCEANIVYDLPVLMVSAPTDNLVLKPNDAGLCVPSGGGTGVSVAATADIASARSAKVSVNDGADQDLALAGTAISGCVPIIQGTNNLAIKLISTTTTATAKVMRKVTYVGQAPTNGLMLTTVTAPADRNGKVTLGWADPRDTEDFDGQFVSYQLRCDASPLDVAAADTAQENAWWDGARVVNLPEDFKPPSNSVQLDLRVGETNHCALRAADATGALTPLTNTSSVTVPFRTAHFAPGTASGQNAGFDFAGVGDVNADGTDDLLVGGAGEAYLVFGSTNGWSSEAPSVTFLGNTSANFGNQVVALGDFNNDTYRDFAIADYSGPTNTSQGRVFVFFGREANNWPTQPIDLRGACAADLCFENTAVNYFGFAIDGIGDFNGDGTPDLAIGAPNYPTEAAGNGRLYIILGKKYEGATRNGDFYQTVVQVPGSPALQGFTIDGDAAGALLGASIAGLGTFDSTAGTDLAVTALGATSNGRVFFLSGRPYDLATEMGLRALPFNEFGFRNGSGTPSGTAFETGPATFGQNLVAVGNVYNLPSANRPGTADLAIWQGFANAFYVYLGDTNFAAADRITVGPQSSSAVYLGESICGGRSSADLDGDGIAELCASGELNPMTGAAPGAASLWYGDVFARKVNAGSINSNSSSLLNPAAAPNVTNRVVEFVGDLNKDGKPDLAIGGNNQMFNMSIAGEFTILY